MGLARIPAKLVASSDALTLVTVPPDMSAMAPRFSRSQASLSTDTTSTVTPFVADCSRNIIPRVDRDAKRIGSNEGINYLV